MAAVAVCLHLGFAAVWVVVAPSSLRLDQVAVGSSLVRARVDSLVAVAAEARLFDWSEYRHQCLSVGAEAAD